MSNPTRAAPEVRKALHALLTNNVRRFDTSAIVPVRKSLRGQNRRSGALYPVILIGRITKVPWLTLGARGTCVRSYIYAYTGPDFDGLELVEDLLAQVEALICAAPLTLGSGLTCYPSEIADADCRPTTGDVMEGILRVDFDID